MTIEHPGGLRTQKTAKMKEILKHFIIYTPFSPDHIGDYIRNLYFRHYIRKLPVDAFTHILDAGCGDGQYAFMMNRRYKNINIACIDIKRSPAFQKQLPTNISYKVDDLRKLNEPGAFNLIYSIDVLEHITQNSRVIENFYSALKPGGYLYLHMPNKTESFIFPRRLFSGFNTWEKKEHIGEMYTLSELKNVVSSKGFEVLVSTHTFGFLGQFLWELDRITDNARAAKILLMPLLKFLSRVAVKIRTNHGDLLIFARK
jgi:2-polyprenyl-3-methyl-5-hydroxy-6-metoxy-1,4-benzoquinol methylase